MNNIILEDLLEIEKEIDRYYFQNKTVLISGASGFLPAYIVDFLMFLNSKNKDQQTKIICLVRNLPKAFKRFKAHKESSLINIIAHDVNIPFDYEFSIDIIIHAASQASPKYYSKDPVGTLLPNVIGTNNLLQLGLIKKISSFLFFSSGEVYGQNENETFNEKDYGIVDPLAVRSCYAESKRMGETLCVSYAHQYKMDIKIVRPFHTYGPKMDLKDGRVFADFVYNIVMNKNLVIKSDGKTERCYCYLKDAVIGFLMVLINGKSGNAYNIGNPNETYSVKGLAKKILETQKQTSLRLTYQEQNDRNYLRSPYSKMIPNIYKVSKLGWKPTTTVIDGFDRTIKSYMNNDK